MLKALTTVAVIGGVLIAIASNAEGNCRLIRAWQRHCQDGGTIIVQPEPPPTIGDPGEPPAEPGDPPAEPGEPNGATVVPPEDENDLPADELVSPETDPEPGTFVLRMEVERERIRPIQSIRSWLQRRGSRR